MTSINAQPHTGRRIIATIIDGIVLLSFNIFFIVTFGERDMDGAYSVHGFKTLLLFIFWFAYLIIPEAIFGATLGHALCGLKVVDMDSYPLTFRQVLKRRLADVIDMFFFGIPALIISRNTPLHQRLGDLWAKTIVVRPEDLTSETSIDFDFEK